MNDVTRVSQTINQPELGDMQSYVQGVAKKAYNFVIFQQNQISLGS